MTARVVGMTANGIAALRHTLPSCAGLTRASIFLSKMLVSKLDGLPGQARQ
jgi:hypothetical protein